MVGAVQVDAMNRRRSLTGLLLVGIVLLGCAGESGSGGSDAQTDSVREASRDAAPNDSRASYCNYYRGLVDAADELAGKTERCPSGEICGTGVPPDFSYHFCCKQGPGCFCLVPDGCDAHF